MYREKIVNVDTNEVIWRNYTDVEIAQVEAAQAESAERLQAMQARVAARQAVLVKLGLTDEEAQALLG